MKRIDRPGSSLSKNKTNTSIWHGDYSGTRDLFQLVDDRGGPTRSHSIKIFECGEVRAIPRVWWSSHEDNVIITETGIENMTILPRTCSEIEYVMAHK